MLEKALVSIRSPNHKPKPTELSEALPCVGAGTWVQRSVFLHTPPSTISLLQDICSLSRPHPVDLCFWPYQQGSPGQTLPRVALKAFDTLVNKRLQTLMGKEVPE